MYLFFRLVFNEVVDMFIRLVYNGELCMLKKCYKKFLIVLLPVFLRYPHFVLQ